VLVWFKGWRVNEGLLPPENKSLTIYFEKTTLNAISALCPDLADRIQGLVERLWDLCACVRLGFYHPGLKGSFSIKAVLPALVPEMTYQGMAVKDGMQAVEVWSEMVKLPNGHQVKEGMERSLLQYCAFDSIAEFMVLEALKNLSTP